MDTKEILKRVDHTLLSTTATFAEYVKLCEEGIKYGVASICIPPCYVYECKNHMIKNKSEIPICTVIGFPNGYNETFIKTSEAINTANNGATEIDMVANISWIKNGWFDEVLNDIKDVRGIIPRSILKVIIETSLLTDDEKKKMCEVVGESGADFIKTSTGFASGGATFKDVALLREYSPPHVKVKASGGINSLEDATEFIRLGADRLGTSKIVKLVQGLGDKSVY
ncbi:MAG: deoxyribose-phosphate aldolase [Defluviitaleaceae bacterium]|nr:deoxyribose-phosphate aldolase [Defluviitaleaceae bacterium]